jgi:hypothetical protein
LRSRIGTIAASGGDSSVASGRGSAIALIDHTDSIAEAAKDFRTVIGGTVVDDDQFEVGGIELLLENARDRHANGRCVIEDWDYDRHPRHNESA